MILIGDLYDHWCVPMKYDYFENNPGYSRGSRALGRTDFSNRDVNKQNDRQRGTTLFINLWHNNINRIQNRCKMVFERDKP
jgi:hypothetical protein